MASHSIENNKALSAYMTEFSSFNIIDPDMLSLEDKQEEKLEGKNEILGSIPALVPNPLINTEV